MSILIIEDEVIFADALATALRAEGLEVVGRVTRGREGLATALKLRPEVVLLDLALPDSDGIDIGVGILERLPETVVLALTSVDHADSAREALSSGFRGYLTKQIPLPRLVTAIRSAQEGETVLSPGILQGVAGPRRQDEDFGALAARHLTKREREVLDLLAAGTSSVLIARSLGISANTVRTHIQNIFDKLQVHSRLEAVALAIRLGLVDTRASNRQLEHPQPRVREAAREG